MPVVSIIGTANPPALTWPYLCVYGPGETNNVQSEMRSSDRCVARCDLRMALLILSLFLCLLWHCTVWWKWSCPWRDPRLQLSASCYIRVARKDCRHRHSVSILTSTRITVRLFSLSIFMSDKETCRGTDWPSSRTARWRRQIIQPMYALCMRVRSTPY